MGTVDVVALDTAQDIDLNSLYSLTVSDPENDTISVVVTLAGQTQTYTVGQSQGAVVAAGTITFSLNLADKGAWLDMNGSIVMGISVQDASDASIETAYTITLTRPNSAPYFVKSGSA